MALRGVVSNAMSATETATTALMSDPEVQQRVAEDGIDEAIETLDLDVTQEELREAIRTDVRSTMDDSEAEDTSGPSDNELKYTFTCVCTCKCTLTC